jgi:hypothetical protein
MANSGLSANEIAGALISMMARSKRSKQRPDTLMQDRYHQLDEVLLRRTAGPYMWAKRRPDDLMHVSGKAADHEEQTRPGFPFFS